MIKNMKITKFVTTCNKKKTISFRCTDNGFVFFVHFMKHHSSGELRIRVSSVSWFPEEFISEEQFHEYNECLYYREISSLIAKAWVEYSREIIQNVTNDGILVSQSLQELGVLDKRKRSCDINGISMSPKTENNSSSEKELFLTTEQPDEKIVKELRRLRPVFKSPETLNSVCLNPEPNGECTKVQTVRDFNIRK